MTPKQKAFVIASLRRSSYRWPGRYNAMKKAHVGRNQYICELCGPDKIHARKEVQLDHKEPVVPTTGFSDGSDFDAHEFAERLLCEEEGFSVLCKEHHEVKTKAENEERRKNKPKKKK